MNKLWHKYRIYSHGRVADAEESNCTPIKSGRTSRNSGRESQNSMDCVVKGSQRPHSSNIYLNIAYNRRPGSTPPIQKVNERQMVHVDRSVSIPSRHLSLADGLQGYELMGISVFRSGDTHTKSRSMSSAFHRRGSQTERSSRQKLGKNPRSAIFLCTETYPRSGVQLGIAPNVREITATDGMVPHTSRTGYNLRYEEIKMANIRNYVLPVREPKLRVGKMQAFYPLTRKNLEMFEYYNLPDVDPEKPIPTPVIEKDPDLDKRVYQWVKERQIQTYSDQPLSDITTDENGEAENKVNDKDSINGKLSSENHLLHGDSPVDDDTPSPDNDISTTPDIAKKAKSTHKVNIVINGVHGNHTDNIVEEPPERGTHNKNRIQATAIEDCRHNNVTR